MHFLFLFAHHVVVSCCRGDRVLRTRRLGEVGVCLYAVGIKPKG